MSNKNYRSNGTSRKAHILWRVISVKIRTLIQNFGEVGQLLHEVGHLLDEVGQLPHEVGHLVYEAGHLLDDVGLLYEVGHSMRSRSVTL